jgi:RHS repeat-associated protein
LTKAGGSEFGYDGADNIIEAPGTANAFDKASQIESATGATFTFDKEGERTKRTPLSGPATTYKYDQAGDLTAIERPAEGETPSIAESFAYDGAGMMASRTNGLNTMNLVWDLGESPEALLSDGEDSYLYGPGGMTFEQISSGEEPTYLHHDQLGSTRLLTNAEGKTTATFSYTPYGALEGHTGTATTLVGFAGQWTDPTTGLQYLRARWYDPGTGQFMTVDPLAGETREPYSYSADDPLNLRDRSGLSWEELEVPCVWPCGPPPAPVVEPLEEAAGAVGGFVEGIFGGSEETSGSVTISPEVFEARAREEEDSEEEACAGELVRRGEELLGRGHSQAGRERFNEWWRGLSKRDKGLYKKAGGPKPSKSQ